MEENTALTAYKNSTGSELACQENNENENRQITEWINTQQLIPPDKIVNVVATSGGTATIGNTFQGNEFNIYNYPPSSSSDETKQREGFIDDLKTKLMEVYKQLTLPCVYWITQERSLEVDKFYVDLKIVYEESEKSISIEEIFNAHGNKLPTRVLVEAQPGFGKTTLATKLAYDWANGKSYMKQFDVAFFIPLRYLKGKTLLELLGEMCKSMKLGEKLDFVESTQVKTLLILDGFDEIHLDSRSDTLKALFKFQFTNATILLTCRSGLLPVKRKELEQIFPFHPPLNTNFQDVKILIKGITEANRVEFLLKFSPGCDPRKVCNQIADLPVENNEMFNCPLFLLQVSYFTMKCKMLDTKSTMTNFYKSVVNNIVKCNLNRDGKLNDEQMDLFDLSDENGRVYQEQMQNFGKLCLIQMEERNYTFEPNDEILDMYKLGLLIKHKVTGFLSTTEYFECFHLSIMEFCSAYFIWRTIQTNGMSVLDNENFTDKILFLISQISGLTLVFVSGLFQAELLPFLKHIKQTNPSNFCMDCTVFWRMICEIIDKDQRLIKGIVDIFDGEDFVHSIEPPLSEFFQSRFYLNVMNQIVLNRNRFTFQIPHHEFCTVPADGRIDALAVNLPIAKNKEKCFNFAKKICCNILWLTIRLKNGYGLPENIPEFYSVNTLQTKHIYIAASQYNVSSLCFFTNGFLSEVRFDFVSCNFSSEIAIEIIKFLLENNRIISLYYVFHSSATNSKDVDQLLKQCTLSSSLEKFCLHNKLREELRVNVHEIRQKQWKSFEIDYGEYYCNESEDGTLCKECETFIEVNNHSMKSFSDMDWIFSLHEDKQTNETFNLPMIKLILE